MRKLELEEIKQLQLNILDVFDAFCREHGLRYQLAYGTLIGAVRHKGYIPWDDDIDLVMPIEDYKRMTEIVNARNDNGMMDERYRLADMFVESTVPYHQSFAKIYDTKTTANASGLRKDAGFKEAVFMDIFPVVGMPEDEALRDQMIAELDNVNTMLYWATKDVKPGNFNPIHPRSALRNMRAWMASRKRTFSEWLSEYARILSRFPDATGAKAAYDIKSVFMDGSRFALDNNPWEPSITMEFEGRALPGPQRYDEMLSRFYGAYMELPPEDQRHPAHDQDYFILD